MTAFFPENARVEPFRFVLGLRRLRNHRHRRMLSSRKVSQSAFSPLIILRSRVLPMSCPGDLGRGTSSSSVSARGGFISASRSRNASGSQRCGGQQFDGVHRSPSQAVSSRGWRANPPLVAKPLERIGVDQIRILPVPARSGGSRLPERIPAVPPRRRERLKVPHTRP